MSGQANQASTAGQSGQAPEAGADRAELDRAFAEALRAASASMAALPVSLIGPAMMAEPLSASSEAPPRKARRAARESAPEAEADGKESGPRVLGIELAVTPLKDLDTAGRVVVDAMLDTGLVPEPWRRVVSSDMFRWSVVVGLIGVPLFSITWAEMIRRRREQRDLLLYD